MHKLDLQFLMIRLPCRHNIGFDVLDEFARSRDIELRKLEKSAVLGKGSVGSRQVGQRAHRVHLIPRKIACFWMRAVNCREILYVLRLSNLY